MSDIRVPHNPAAEQMTLGNVMLDNAVAPQVLWELAPEDYFIPRHRYVFQAMRSLERKNHAIDPLTVTEELHLMNLANECDPAFIGSLLDGVPRLSNVKEYVRIIKNAATLRKALNVSRWLGDEAVQSDADVDALLTRLSNSVSDLQQSRLADDMVCRASAIQRTMQTLEERWQSGNELIGLPTGFTDLDRVLLGLRGGKYYCLAAPTGMGKTTLALNFADNIITHSKGDQLPVGLVITLEMGVEELEVRCLSTHTRIDSNAIESGRLTEEEKNKVREAATFLARLPIEYVESFASVTAQSIVARAEKIRLKYGRLDFVVVDYLQLLDSDDRKENENLRLTEISRTLKRIAVQYRVPVIVISQMNRSHSSRSGAAKDPELSDLRGSGSIEQDSDVVMFLVPGDWSQPESPERRLIIRKHRGGKKGVVNLVFFGDQSRFENAAGEAGYGGEYRPEENEFPPRSRGRMSAEEKRAWLAEYEEGVMP